MRIDFGGISHETSSFSKVPTARSDFETSFGIYRGPEIIPRFTQTNICTGGFIERFVGSILSVDAAATHSHDL